MIDIACDDCGRLAPVLVLTDYGCRYCRACLRPGAITAKPKIKKPKAPSKQVDATDYGEDVF